MGNSLGKITNFVKKKEKEIGKELHAANIETRDAMTTLGSCPKCKDGKLQIRKGKFGFFAACNNYRKRKACNIHVKRHETRIELRYYCQHHNRRIT